MNPISEDRPEINEGKVTYTYDDNDRLLYRNVYDGDRARRSIFNSGTVGNNLNFKPIKLLYQDVYLYNNAGVCDIKRIYQPEIDITGYRDDDAFARVIAFVTCKSKVLATGFIWNASKENLLESFLYPNKNLFNNADYKGKRAVGELKKTIINFSTIHVKAYVVMETGTLFSKTITIEAE
jgi:hypothetical protein